MRKLPSHYENPLDDLMYLPVELTSNGIHSFGLTPNMLTTLACIFKLASLRYLWVKAFIPFVACLYMGYFLDFLDGYQARKFSMETQFGDSFDHISDTIQYVAAIAILFLHGGLQRHPVSFFILCFLCMVHLGCQQRYFTRRHSNRMETLNGYISFCPNEKDIAWTRFMGPGTVFAVFVWMVYMTLE